MSREKNLHGDAKNSRVAFSVVTRLILLLIMPFTMHTMANGQLRSTESLSFFRVIAEKSEYEKSPNRFQISKHVDKSGKVFELYIERNPSFTLPVREIVSVTIEKQRKYGAQYGIEEVIKDMKKSGSERDQNAKGTPLGFTYTASIVLTQSGQKLFSEFAKRNEGEDFDCRLGTNSLTIAQLVPPGVRPGTTSSRFLLSLGGKDQDQIKTIFGSIEDKVKWQ